MSHKTISGSAGLISLLIGILIMSFLYVYFFLTPREISNPELKAIQPTTASGTVPTTSVERARADVDAARATQELLNARNRATNAALGE